MATFSKFRGINNQDAASAMKPDDLAGCVNFVVDDGGQLFTRPGLDQAWAGVAHSIVEFDGQIYFRTGTSLMRLGSTSVAVDSSLGTGSTCYAKAPGALLYSDGNSCRMLERGASASWGITPPAFSAVSTELDASKHTHKALATVTYMRGRYESGASTPVEIGCTASGASATVTIPDSAQATHKAIYMSMPGGETMRLAAVIPNGQTSATVTATASGPELQTLHKTPPPPHALSAVRNGRALVAVDNFILYSDPFKFDLFDPIRQSIPFQATVTMLAEVSPDALIVGTTAGVYRLAGADMDAVSIIKLSDLGVPLGAYATVDASLFSQGQGLAVVFASAGGFCLVGQDGGVTNLTGDRYRPGPFMAGSSAFSRQPGNHSVVFSLRH